MLAGGVGMVGYAIHGLSAKITAPGGDMSKYPKLGWVPGVAMLVAGAYMRNKPKLTTVGIALQGAAGFSLAEYGTLAYTIAQNAKQQAAAQANAPATTQGFETGAVMGFNDVHDAGALLNGYQYETGGYQDVDANYAAAMAM
jgi:hypothetical protein